MPLLTVTVRRKALDDGSWMASGIVPSAIRRPTYSSCLPLGRQFNCRPNFIPSDGATGELSPQRGSPLPKGRGETLLLLSLFLQANASRAARPAAANSKVDGSGTAPVTLRLWL